MEKIKLDRGLKWVLFSLFFFLFFTQDPFPTKIKVTVDNASVKKTMDIGGTTLVRISLNTILDAEEKKGEWFKISMENEGFQISGYIHEMLVKVLTEEELSEYKVGIDIGSKITQEEIIGEIETRIEENKDLIREERALEKAGLSLRPLIANTFNVTDLRKQKELVTEIYLWMGLSWASQGDKYSALQELKNMFTVDHLYAKRITRNIFDPEVTRLIQQAEKEILGQITEYTLDISTDPEYANLRVNGEDIGPSPKEYRSLSPMVVLEIEKEGYNPLKDEVFLTQAVTKKVYILERAGRNVQVTSKPKEAKVYLDGEDVDKKTDCLLPMVSFGIHNIKVVKENYAEWEREVKIEEEDSFLPVEALLTVNNYSFLGKWGAPKLNTFQLPAGIVLDQANNFYVIDESTTRVKKFSPDGNRVRDWGSGDRELKRLKAPAGIAIDSEGSIYVTDAKKHCVVKFDRNGGFIKKWGKEGSGTTNFNTPLGIAVDRNDDIYIVDSRNNRIKKYSKLGVLRKIWGKQGSADGDLLFPVAIALNQKNEVFVFDRARTQKFTAEGDYIAIWGKTGVAKGALRRPMGACFDSDNYLYVADTGNKRIQKFDETGALITSWGAVGIGDGQMNYPCGIAIDQDGNIFVADRDNNRIQKFGVSSQSESE